MKPGDLVLVSGHKTPSIFLGWDCGEEQTKMTQLLHDGRIIEVHYDYLITSNLEWSINEAR